MDSFNSHTNQPSYEQMVLDDIAQLCERIIITPLSGQTIHVTREDDDIHIVITGPRTDEASDLECYDHITQILESYGLDRCTCEVQRQVCKMVFRESVM